jgi:hypothetical protein
VLNSLGNSFLVNNSNNVIFRNCTATADPSFINFGLANTGFNLTGFSFILTNCTVTGGYYGFYSIGAILILTNCAAERCLSDGFYIGQNINANAYLDNCVAQRCIGAGFVLDRIGSTMVRNSSALFNVGSGFMVDATPVFFGITVDRCIASYNGGYGFVAGQALNLQAVYTTLGAYSTAGAGANTYAIQFTNNITVQNGLFANFTMVLTITDPAHIQPTLTNQARQLSPTVGICSDSNGTLLNDATVGSANINPPIAAWNGNYQY